MLRFNNLKEAANNDPKKLEIFILANERYEFIQGERLKKLTDYSNKILYSYSKSKKITYEGERIIIEFFKTIKFLIERAPN